MRAVTYRQQYPLFYTSQDLFSGLFCSLESLAIALIAQQAHVSSGVSSRLSIAFDSGDSAAGLLHIGQIVMLIPL